MHDTVRRPPPARLNHLTASADQPPSCGISTAPWSTPSRIGSSASTNSSRHTAARGAKTTPTPSSAVTCANPLATSASTVDVDLPTDEIVNQLLDGVIARVRRKVPWRPGARDLLAQLRTEKIPCALVTMSWRRLADAIVGELPRGSFAATIVGDEVRRGKPHPEPYLAAARALSVSPKDCVALEDSPTGVRSATAAGCHVIAIPAHRRRAAESRTSSGRFADRPHRRHLCWNQHRAGADSPWSAGVGHARGGRCRRRRGA